MFTPGHAAQVQTNHVAQQLGLGATSLGGQLAQLVGQILGQVGGDLVCQLVADGASDIHLIQKEKTTHHTGLQTGAQIWVRGSGNGEYIANSALPVLVVGGENGYRLGPDGRQIQLRPNQAPGLLTNHLSSQFTVRLGLDAARLNRPHIAPAGQALVKIRRADAQLQGQFFAAVIRGYLVSHAAKSSVTLCQRQAFC